MPVAKNRSQFKRLHAMGAVFHEIKQAAIELEIGQSTKEHLCPQCGGGQSKEKAFNITRGELGVLYKCHRGKCGFAGFIPTMLSSLEATPEKPHRRKVRPYAGLSRGLLYENGEVAYFWDMYGLYALEIKEFSLDVETGRIVQPWHNVLGHVAGHILRSYDKSVKPKSLTYWNNDGVPILDYYVRFPEDSTIWLVEDQLSAIKLSRYENAAALIGVHLSEDKAADIRKYFDTVYIALDCDATLKAIAQREKYALYFKNFHVVPLSKDIKDMSDEAIRNLLEDTYGSEAVRRGTSRAKGI